MISHDREFMQELCTETWLVENGEVDVIEEEMVEGKIVRKKREKKGMFVCVCVCVCVCVVRTSLWVIGWDGHRL